MFDINKCYDCFATEPNSAYFWSGLGENGQDIAAQIADENGGTTLEMLMDKNKDELISAGFLYDEDLRGFSFSPENIQDWQAVSQAFAEQASGEGHAGLGDNIREGGVWNTKEYPVLSENDTVNKIIAVDPTTKQDKIVLLDKNTTAQNNASAIAGELPPPHQQSNSSNNGEIAGTLPEGKSVHTANNNAIAGTTPDKAESINLYKKNTQNNIEQDLTENVGKKAEDGINSATGIT